MTLKTDVLLRHYASITKRVSDSMDTTTESLRTMSYDVREGFAVGEETIKAVYGALDTAIKELNHLREMMKYDLGDKNE